MTRFPRAKARIQPPRAMPRTRPQNVPVSSPEAPPLNFNRDGRTPSPAVLPDDTSLVRMTLAVNHFLSGCRRWKPPRHSNGWQHTLKKRRIPRFSCPRARFSRSQPRTGFSRPRPRRIVVSIISPVWLAPSRFCLLPRGPRARNRHLSASPPVRPDQPREGFPATGRALPIQPLEKAGGSGMDRERFLF